MVLSCQEDGAKVKILIFGALSGYILCAIDGGVAELTMPILVGDEVMWRLDSGRGEGRGGERKRAE